MRGPKLLSVVRFLDRPHPPTPGGCFQLFKEKRGGGCPRRMRAFLTTCGQTDSGHTSWGSVRTPSPGLSWQQNPAVLALNSSFLVHTFGASLVAQVSSGDTFARAHIHSACGHRAHLDTGLQHAWPPLQALGVPPNNHIRVSVGGDEPPRAQLEVALGLCTLTARGDFRSEASVTHNWTLALVNQNRSRSNGFLPDVYQIRDEVTWLIPEKGRLISTASICWEQTEPSPKVSQQLNYNDWKQMGYLSRETCNVIIPVRKAFHKYIQRGTVPLFLE